MIKMYKEYEKIRGKWLNYKRIYKREKKILKI